MGMSKKDLARRHAILKAKLIELERKALNDPLGRDRKLHEEIIKIKKELLEN